MLTAGATRIVHSDGASVGLMRFCTGPNELLYYHSTLKDEFHWLDLVAYHQSVLDIRFGRCDMCSGVAVGIRLPGSGGGVGRGNKFVLLDITEEPEAKKLTVYNTNENLMER